MFARTPRAIGALREQHGGGPLAASGWDVNVRHLALTVSGRDRARSRVVEVPLPDPGEDNGHLISHLVLGQAADARGGARDEDGAAGTRRSFTCHCRILRPWMW
jgi:hypothetical protein